MVASLSYLCICCVAYYAFVYQYCFVLVNIIAIKVVCLVIYHVILVLFFWSYYQTVTTPLALVPKKVLLPEDVKEELRNVLDYPGYQEATVLILNRFAIQLKTTLNNVSYEGGPRRCEKCVNQCIKPDRTHHCSICKVCILKYDHHCLGLIPVSIMRITSSSFSYCSTDSSCAFHVGIYCALLRCFLAHVLCLFFVSILFGSPISCLLGDHLYLIKLNQTTPESTGHRCSAMVQIIQLIIWGCGTIFGKSSGLVLGCGFSNLLFARRWYRILSEALCSQCDERLFNASFYASVQ
uniref:Protein S-acyltransferase n=1 Tax=Ditylenchus dipsaci TaxID=166011 RepID=A0A915E052_9BILA